MCIRRGLSHAFPDKRETLLHARTFNSKLFLFDNHFPEKIEPGAFVKINFRARTKKYTASENFLWSRTFMKTFSNYRRRSMFFNGNQFQIALHTRFSHSCATPGDGNSRIGNKFSAQNEIKIKQIRKIYLCVESFKMKFDDFSINTRWIIGKSVFYTHPHTHAAVEIFIYAFRSYWCIGQWLCSWGRVGNERITSDTRSHVFEVMQ